MKNIILLILLLFIVNSYALYEEQIGEKDWYSEQIGKIKNVIHSENNIDKNIYVITEESVLAALSFRNGNVKWRQVLNEDEEIDYMTVQHVQKNVLTLSGNCQVARMYSAKDGSLFWESNSFRTNNITNDNDDRYPCKGLFIDINTARDDVILLMRNTVTSRDGGTGRIRWKYESKQQFIGNMIVHKNRIYLLTVDDNTNSIKFITLNSKTGAVLSSGGDGKMDDVVIDKDTKNRWEFKTALIRTKANNYIHVIIRKSSVLLSNMKTGKSKVVKDVSKDMLESVDIKSKYSNIMLSNGDLYHIEDNLTLKKVQNIIPCDINNSNNDISYEMNNEELIIGSFKVDLLTHGDLEDFYCFRYMNKKTNKNGFRLGLIMKDESIIWIQNNKLKWKREESLASIISAQMIDQPALTTFDEVTGFPSFFERIQPQMLTIMNTLQHYINIIPEKVKKILEGDLKSSNQLSESNADYFGFRKYILTLTKVGKLLTLDSSTGTIVYTYYFPSYLNKECKYEYNLNIVQHHQCRVIAVSNDKQCNSVIINFDCTNKKVGLSFDNLDYHPIQWNMLPYRANDKSHLLLLIDNNNSAHVYPDTDDNKNKVLENIEKLHVHRTDKINGNVKGYVIDKVHFNLIQIWEINFPKDTETIEEVSQNDQSIVMRSRIRKIGKETHVKYLNPHMIVIATSRILTSERPLPSVKRSFDPSVNIYIIDGITGTVLQKSVHRQCKGPVHIAQSENTVLYHYFNIIQNQYEISVVNLYDDLENLLISDDETFSSFHHSLPIRKQQAYLFASGVNAIGVTRTRFGVSDKKFLFGLSNNQIFAVPSKLLDPHRPMIFDMTSEEAKKAHQSGLIPYRSDIIIDPKSIISYYKPVHRIRGILSQSATVESTSLTFTYGLDLFYSRVTPVSEFDMLNEAVNAPLILITLSAVALACIVTRRMATEKTYTDAWE